MNLPPDTLTVNNRDHVTVAPHHWTRVSRLFSRPRPRNRWQRLMDRLLGRAPEEELLVLSVHVRVACATDIALELVGQNIEPAGPHHRHMREMSVQG